MAKNAAERAPRQPMPERDAQERARTFDEVALGYSAETARIEAERCLQCKKPPCENGCPVEVRIRDFIAALAEGDLPAASVALKERNALPAVCGRVCPQETQCEAQCVLGRKGEPVAIGRLERYVADWDRDEHTRRRLSSSCGATIRAHDHEQVAARQIGLHSCLHDASSTRSTEAVLAVAVVGSGPAGLTCAAELTQLGYDVTVFEAMHALGGVLAYGIPAFRLPNDILEDEIDSLRRAGVKFELNALVGRITDAEELLAGGFAAVFFGTGAGLPTFLGIEGENFNGVYSANEFLTRINLMHAHRFPAYDTPIWQGREVVVIGGGNVAMDAARCALRMRAERVSIVYRRTVEEMPARVEEIHHACEEGVAMRELCAPLRIVGSQGWCTGLEVQSMQLGEPDESGRRRPESDGSEPFVIPCDTIITAVGTGANVLTREATSGVELNKWGYVVTDEDGRTSHPRIYAGGDIVTGAATVILAMGAGKKAAHAINTDLNT
ncbi:MAG: NADPH-dependent glutamate synthase [Coriobacteriia bacterium]|nr:NADPH-dependent glutamate synthase [Coriobacteriia bacterium]